MVGDGRPVVSQVREPLISQAPEPSPPGAEEDARTPQSSQGDEQRADDEDNQNEEANQRSQAEQGQGNSSQAQVPASATASASATAETPPATAEPGAASSLEATEEPDERSPVSVRAPASARQSVTVPPSSSPATGRPTAAPSGGSRNRSGDHARSGRLELVARRLQKHLRQQGTAFFPNAPSRVVAAGDVLPESLSIRR